MGAFNVEKDIRDYLTNTTGLSNVTTGMLAPSPKIQYAVVEYPGPSSTKTHGGSSSQATIALDNAMIQIAARHTATETARTNILAVVDALDGLSNVTVNSVVYTYIEMVARPRLHERAEDGTVTFIAEFRVQARR